MNKERKLIIAGNWKMNKTVAEALDLVRSLKIELANVKEVDMVVCPPFTALCEVSKAILDSNIRLGAQNMSEHNVGAYTGEIAAVMLKEFSVRYVILGHSERRQYQKEPDALIARKAAAVHDAALKPIVCVGETLAEREAGQMQKVLETQVRGSLAGLSKDQMAETVARLRAGLGHRHRQDRHDRAGAGSPCLYPGRAGQNVRRNSCPAGPYPIWWQCEAVQRPRVDEPAGRGWRAGRRCLLGSAQLCGHH